MVFKIKVTFDTPIAIFDSEKLPLHERVVIVLVPLTTDDGVTEAFVNSRASLQTLGNGWDATLLGETRENVFSFIPTSIKINKGIFPNVNGSAIFTIPSNFDKIHRYIGSYKFIYVEADTHQKIKRAAVPSNTSKLLNKSAGGVVRVENGVTVAKNPPKLESAEITDKNPHDIVFNFTPSRDVFVYDSQNPNTPQIEPPIGDMFTFDYVDHDVYKSSAATEAASLPFQLGILNINNSNKTITVSRTGGTTGRLTENSQITATLVASKSQADEYRFDLVTSNSFEFKNNIVNPKIYGFIDPNDNKDGYIVLRLSKDNGNTFVSEFSQENGSDHTIAPHNDITLTALTNEGTTPSFYGEVDDGNTIGSDFSLYQDINSNNDANIHFKNEFSSYFNTDTIKLRVNRFARSDLNYTLRYNHPTNIISGIFEKQGENLHHAVLPMTVPISLSNLLQPIVIDTVSEVKVYYPSSKPHHGATWNNTEIISNSENSEDIAYQYNSYTAYFYVDVTFKNANTNQPVSITAKYDTDGPYLFDYQESGGHKLHHGLILNYDGNEIPEEITQTTIRDSNDNVVDLKSGANGTKLRIEFPAGNNGPNGSEGTKNAYNTNNDGKPSSYGFTNPTKTLKITFDDRQEKNFDGSNSTDYYYINLMDSNGNVCLAFDKTVSFPNNWGADSIGQSPTIVSAVVNAIYTEEDIGGEMSGSWSDKQLVLTFAQDIYDNGLSPLTFSLSKDINLGIKTPLTLTTPEGSVSEKTVTLNCASVKEGDQMVVDYIKPTGTGYNNNTGLYDNILYNWFGFEINNFSNFSVTNSLNEIPTVTNIVFTNGTLNIDDYEGTLTWSVSGTDSDKVVEYTIEKASTFNATTWTPVGTSATTSLSVTGLAYENDVYYRIRAKTYDYGEYTVSSLVRQNLEDEEEFAILSLTNKSTETLSVPFISVSWEAVTGATQYQVQFSLSSSFDIIYGTRLFSNANENLTTSTDIDYITIDTGTGDNYPEYLSASTTYYVRVRADTPSASGWNHITPGQQITTKSATPTSLSVSFSRTDRILPALSANWSVVGESDKYHLRLYHLTYNQDGEEPDTITTWEPFTHAEGLDDRVYIETNNGGTNNSVTDLTGITLLENNGETLTQTFLDTVDTADNMLTKIAFAVRAHQTRSDNDIYKRFLPFYPEYDADNGSFSPGTIYNTVPTSITFTSEPTVTQSIDSNGNLQFSLGFPTITDATKYRLTVTPNLEGDMPDSPVYLQANLDSSDSPITPNGTSNFENQLNPGNNDYFTPAGNSVYEIKYEPGLGSPVEYFTGTGNTKEILSRYTSAPAFFQVQSITVDDLPQKQLDDDSVKVEYNTPPDVPFQGNLVTYSHKLEYGSTSLNEAGNDLVEPTTYTVFTGSPTTYTNDLDTEKLVFEVSGLTDNTFYRLRSSISNDGTNYGSYSDLNILTYPTTPTLSGMLSGDEDNATQLLLADYTNQPGITTNAQITLSFTFQLDEYDANVASGNQNGYPQHWDDYTPTGTSPGGNVTWIYDGSNTPPTGNDVAQRSIRNLTKNTAYKLRLKASNQVNTANIDGGYIGYSDEVEDITFPDNQSSPSYYSSGTHSTTEIPFKIVKETDVLPNVKINGSTPGYAYKIEWATQLDGNSDLTGTISSTTFYDDNLIDVGGGTNNVHNSITGLTSNTLYYLAVSKSNQKNKSPIPFTSRSVDTNGILTLPDAVTNFSTSVSGTTITLTWDNVSGNGTINYKLEVDVDDGNGYSTVNNSATSPYTYTGTYNTNYTFRITASNISSNGPPGGDSGAVTASAIIGSNPDNSPPSYSSGSWYISTDNTNWGNAITSATTIPNNRYIKYTFTATDATAVQLTSGGATLKAGTSTVATGLSLSSDSGVANEYYISYQIPSTNSNNGVLSLVFTLTDGTNTGSLITETSQITLDTAQPSASNFEWYYAEPAIIALGGGFENTGPNWTSLSNAITIGPDYKVKVEFTATDVTNVLIDSSGVKIAGNNMTFPDSTNTDDAATVEYSGTSDIYNVTMIYTIPSTGTPNANGSLSFELVLTDGVSGNNTITLNPANSSNTAVTITVDTTAPTLITGGPGGPGSVASSGNLITIEFNDDLDSDTLATGTSTGFSLQNGNAGNYTGGSSNSVITITGVSLNSNDSKKLDLTLSDTILTSDQDPYIMWSAPNSGAITDEAGNEFADLTSAIQISNGSNQTGDIMPPSLSNFAWKFTSPTNDTTPEFEIQSDEAGTITATYNNGNDNFTVSPGSISANSLTTFTLSDSTGSALSDGTYSNISITVADAANNSSSVSDSTGFVISTGPTFSSAVVARTTPRKIVITFSSSVTVTGSINKDNFTVYQDSVQGTIESASIVSGKVELVLDEEAPVQEDEVVTVDYTKSGTSSENLRGASTGPVLSFTNKPVTNNVVYILPLVRDAGDRELMHFDIPYYNRTVDAEKNIYYFGITGQRTPDTGTVGAYPLNTSSPIVIKEVTTDSNGNYQYDGITTSEWKVYNATQTSPEAAINSSYGGANSASYTGGQISNISSSSSHSGNWKWWDVNDGGKKGAIPTQANDDVTLFITHIRDSSGNIKDNLLRWTSTHDMNGTSSLWSTSSYKWHGIPGFAGSGSKVPNLQLSNAAAHYAKDGVGVILKYTATEKKTITLATATNILSYAPFALALDQAGLSGGTANDAVFIVFTQHQIDKWKAENLPSPPTIASGSWDSSKDNNGNYYNTLFSTYKKLSGGDSIEYNFETKKRLQSINLTNASITLGTGSAISYGVVQGSYNLEARLNIGGTTNNNGNYENKIIYHIPGVFDGSITGVVSDLTFTIIDSSQNETTYNNGDIYSNLTEVAVDTTLPQIDQSGNNFVEQNKVQVYIGGAWTDKTTTNGLGNNQNVAYNGERIYYSFQATELLPINASEAFLLTSIQFSSAVTATTYNLTTKSIDNSGNTSIDDCVMTYTIPSSNAPVGVPYFNFTLQDRAMNQQSMQRYDLFGVVSGGIPAMAISSSTVTSGSSSQDSSIDLIFTSLGRKTNDFELSDISLNNTTNGTLSNFITVFKVTVVSVTGGNKYFINGIQQDSLVLKSGNTYRFDQSDSTNGSHPLRFSTTSNGTSNGYTPYTTGVTVVGAQGQSGSYTQIEITGSTPTPLYYYCTAHPGMGNQISISNSNLTGSRDYLATLTVDSSGNYTIDISANKFTDDNAVDNLASTQFSWTYDPPSWSQLGADIDGEAAGDKYGWSVSLSSDGSIVAIGAVGHDGMNGNNSGHVKVYQYNSSNTSWSQLGSDIDGEAADDQSGFSVSLSNDGSIVAIGARDNDGNGSNSGHVRVYEYSSGSWTQKGSDIDGEAGGDESGYSVSLSSDGTIVAIGARTNDGNGSNSGHVRVYEYSSGSWTQKGSDIDGAAAGDQSGYSVSLSSDGSIVAIGAVRYTNGSDKGLVRVYEWDGSNWDQKGTDLYGEANLDESGYSVSLSSDGSILAIGAIYNDAGNANNDNRGHVRVYKWVVSDGEAPSAWGQLGSDIDGEAAGDESGYSVSLSSDGSILAIGAIYNDAGNADTDNRGHVRVYEYNSSNNSWSQLGSDIDGKVGNESLGFSVAIDASGNTVAIGVPYHDGDGQGGGDNRGCVRVYEYS